MAQMHTMYEVDGFHVIVEPQFEMSLELVQST